jgi:excisionase family DNA binding protein
MALPAVELTQDRHALASKGIPPSSEEHMLPELLTFKEAMVYLRVSRSTLYRLICLGQLTGHKVGSTWRFYRADLQANIRVIFPSHEDTPDGGSEPAF